MTKVERLGMRLAELIRRERDHSAWLHAVKEEIDEVIEQIRDAPDGVLYEGIDLDATVAGVGMSPIVPCPGPSEKFSVCTIVHRHVHTADGKLHVLPE